MPYANEHAARQADPGRYEKFRRENGKFGDGIDAIWGITEDGAAELQSVRFDASKFKPEQAKKWLEEHDMKVGVEPASEKKEEKAMNDQLLEAIRQRQAAKTEFGYGIATADRYAKNVLDAVGLEVAYKCAATRTISWDDVMKKAARTLVYSNPDMVTEEIEYSRRAGSSLKRLDDIELPKNCLMVFRHVLTTPRKDRDGDVLRTQGAKVDPKMILLWNHVHTLPIGKMLAVADHNSKKLSLISCIVDMNDLSHDCAVMIDNGMGRFSHGFRAIEFTKIKSADGEKEAGFDVMDFEIMEESLVTVPSNTDAEVEEVMLGLAEGGKMTSPIMKEYGKSIRAKRPLVVGGVDLTKISLPIDLKITLNGKEIKDADMSRDGGGEAEGAEQRGTKDETGLDEKADAKAAGGKAEEGETDDAKMKCPECGVMVSKSAKVCPECGYKFEEGAETSEDEVEEGELEEKSVKFGRTFSRKNLTTLKEIHADVEELDVGDHVLSVRGREITKGCRKKIKAMIDEHDIPDDVGGVEEGKSFEKGDLPGHPFRGNQYGGGGGSSGGGSSGGESELASSLGSASKYSSELEQKSMKAKSISGEQSDMAGTHAKQAAEYGASAYKRAKAGDQKGASEHAREAAGAHKDAARAHRDAASGKNGDAALSKSERDEHRKLAEEHSAMWREYSSALKYGKSFGVEDAMAMLIADATPNQRATVRKAFDMIEQVERMNLQAKQYRALMGKGDLPGHPFRGNQHSGGGGSSGGKGETPRDMDIYSIGGSRVIVTRAKPGPLMGSYSEGYVDVQSHEEDGSFSRIVLNQSDSEQGGSVRRFGWHTFAALQRGGHAKYEGNYLD